MSTTLPTRYQDLSFPTSKHAHKISDSSVADHVPDLSFACHNDQSKTDESSSLSMEQCLAKFSGNFALEISSTEVVMMETAADTYSSQERGASPSDFQFHLMLARGASFSH